MSGCFLTERERMWLMITLQENATWAGGNARDAVQDSRIDLLTGSGPGWDMGDQLLFEIGTGVIGAIFSRAARYMAGRLAGALAETPLDRVTLAVANVSDAAIGKVYKSISASVRAELKHRRSMLPAGNAGKAEFLRSLRDGIVRMFRNLGSAAASMNDDETLIALAFSLGQEDLHGPDAYAAEIAIALARYDANHIDEIGQTESRGKRVGQDGADEEIELGRLRWVTTDGKRRLGLFRGPAGNATDFVRWIDTDWQALALSQYRERTRTEPDEMSADGLDVTVTPGAPTKPGWLDGIIGGPHFTGDA